MDRGDHVERRDMSQQQAYRDIDRHDDRHEEHRHKVWVPSHHDHDHLVRGYYEWR